MSQTTTAPKVARALALAVLCVIQLMIILDGTIVTVALPTIQGQLGFSQAGLAWVMNAYLISFAGLLLLSGRLGDLVGRKQVLLFGLSIFTAASAVCGVANSQTLLIAGRFAQGVGAALASAVILGMIVALYPKPAEQAKAIGIYSFVSAGGASIGLIIGGLITQSFGWHWAFLINVPIGVIAFSLALRLIEPERGLGIGKGADALGAVLVTSGLSLAVYAIIQSAEPSTNIGQTLIFGAVSVLLLLGFVLRQAKATQPLVNLRIFRNRQVSIANIIVVLVFASGFGFQFLTALYLQRVLGYDSLQTGLAFLPGPIMIGLISLFLSSRLIARFGPGPVLLVGLAAFATALLWLSRAPTNGDYSTDILPVLVLMGSGMGLAIPPVIMLAMGGVDTADAGLASGLNNTAQQAGAAVGTAILATISTTHTAARIDQGTPTLAALRDGYSLAFLAASGLVAIALMTALVLLRRVGTQSPPLERTP